MPKKLSDRIDRMEGLIEKILVSITVPEKVSTSETKKVNTTKLVVDNLKSVAGLTLAIGHPRKKVMGKDGKQIIDKSTGLNCTMEVKDHTRLYSPVTTTKRNALWNQPSMD